MHTRVHRKWQIASAAGGSRGPAVLLVGAIGSRTGAGRRRDVLAVEIGPAEIAIVREGAEDEGKSPRDIDLVRVAVGIGRWIIGEARLRIVAHLLPELLTRPVVVIGADDR